MHVGVFRWDLVCEVGSEINRCKGAVATGSWDELTVLAGQQGAL